MVNTGINSATLIWTVLIGNIGVGQSVSARPRDWPPISRLQEKNLTHSVFSSMVVPGVNPHWFGPARALKATLAVEFDGASIRDEHVLVKFFS